MEKDAIGTREAISWGIDRIDENDLPLDGNFHPAHTGSGVHVYIIDSGIRATHNEFNGRVGAGSPGIFPNTNDVDGHGTSVAGCAVGATYGVAVQATVHPVKDGDAQPTTAQTIAGINWVASNFISPAVCNISTGYTTAGNSAVDTAVNALINAGVTVVVSAGNNSGNVTTRTPARVANAVTVGATTNSDAFASSYSNFGSGVDLLAPGTSIKTATNTSDSASTTISGTSFSSPYTAGVAALYLQDNPTDTPAQVRSNLLLQAVSGTITSVPSGTVNKLLNVVNAGITVPATPTNATIGFSGANFNLTWSDNATNEIKYVIERSTDLVNWTLYDTVFANVESYSDALPAGNSFFRIGAESHAGSGIRALATSGPPPPGSSTAHAEPWGETEVYKTVAVPAGAVVSGYAEAGTTDDFDFASAEVSGPGAYVYADSLGDYYEKFSFSGASSGSYNLFAEQYTAIYAEAKAYISW